MAKTNQAMFGGKGPQPSMMGVGHPPARPTGVHGQTPATHNGGATPQKRRSMPSAKANGRHGSGRLSKPANRGQSAIPNSGPQAKIKAPINTLKN